MDDLRLKAVAGIVGVALCGTVGVGAIVGSYATAGDLQPKAIKALRSAGLTGIMVDFNGREAKLSGGVADERSEAISVVEHIGGVRWAKFSGRPTASLSAPTVGSGPSVGLSRSNDGATISGVVPSAEIAADLKTTAAEAFGGSVSGDFRIAPSVRSAGWLNELPEVFGDLVGVKNLEIEIRSDGSSIRIGGSIESQVGADRAKEIVTAAMPDLTVDSTITVNPGRLDSDDAATLNSAVIYFPRGSSRLSATSIATLDRVFDVLNRNVGVNVEAGGHAGPNDPAQGRILSNERVNAVKAYLMSSGLDSDRVSTRSFGSAGKSAGDQFAKRYRRVDFAIEEN